MSVRINQALARLGNGWMLHVDAVRRSAEPEGARDINRDSFGGRNIHFGVREHAMGAILNGVALAAKLRVFESGFLIFSDDRRGSLRCRRSWKFQ
jgi:transketolase